MTPQYLDFNVVLQNYTGRGLRLLAFPCNQFLLQEPGKTPYELMNGLTYVRPGYGYVPHPNITFYGKLDVNGDTEHPLYTFMKSACPATTEDIGDKTMLAYDHIRASDIWWNFEKFLIDKKGRPRYRFNPTAWFNGLFIQPFLEELLNEPDV